MPIAFWCVLVAGLLPVLTVSIAKMGGRTGFDNHDPRAWLKSRAAGRAARTWPTATTSKRFRSLPRPCW